MTLDGVSGEADLALPHVRLSLATACNFRCTYCPPWGENSYSRGDRLSPEVVVAAIAALSRAGFRVLKLTGGEPTLRPDVVDIAEQACSHFEEVRLITNGCRLEQLADDLQRVGLAMVEVSLDAASDDTFDQVTHTRGQLPKVLAGIRTALASGLPLQINSVLLTETIDEMPLLVDLLESLDGGVTLKLLELVYYDFPGYDFWRNHFVDPHVTFDYLESRAIGSSWEAPPGRFGSPMRAFHFGEGKKVLVKDGRVGSTYSRLCEGCPLFPCQDGLYGLTVTESGDLKFCKHREDLNVSLGKPGDQGRTYSEESIGEAVRNAVAEYSSAEFRAGAWSWDQPPTQATSHQVEPTDAIRDWYGPRGSAPPETARLLEETGPAVEVRTRNGD